MDNAKRKLLLSLNLTNSDLEAMYLGKPLGEWVMKEVVDEYEGPDGWHVIEFTFMNMDSQCKEQKLRGHLFVGRVFYKIHDKGDPYGRHGHVWESALLGERNYPW
ncbi:hypothetical protein VPHD148_0314 [Vibrio phage D148]